MRVVEQVEELGPELQAGALTEVEGDVFDGREIYVDVTRAVKRGAGGGAEFPGGSVHEGARIEPTLNCMYGVGGGAGWVGGYRAGFIRIADFVGTVHAQEVVVKERSGIVGAIDDEEREAGSGLDDGIGLPVAEDGVDRPAPVGAPGFAFAEGQVVENAAGETVIEIEL